MPRTYTSYTHNCEDVMLLRALGDQEAGFYIDVGAYDPVMDSVTNIFYEKGWSGINIEPNEFYLERLRNERLRDVNLGCLVSDKAGALEFYIVENTGLSTLDPDQAAVHADAGRSLKNTTVQTEVLYALWDQYVPEFQDVHFLKIDVEGAEAQVIAGADWARHRPWIIVVEATLPNTLIPSHEIWEPTLLNAKYLFAYFDGVNRYYVAEEKRHLLAAFQRPANPAVDNFKPFMAELIERNMQESIRQLQEKLQSTANREEALENDVRSLSESNRALMDQNKELLESQLSQLHSSPNGSPNYESRKLLERLVFRPSGKPKKIFRKMLFHASGKPRGIFRNRVLKHNGAPRRAFRQWMTSPEYLRLPWAVHFFNEGSLTVAYPTDPAELSLRAQEIFDMLKSRQ